MHKTKDRSIYPNPATDKINLYGYGSSIVTIKNMSGETVLSTTLQEGESLNINDLVPGYYIMIVEENETVFTHQFIKK